jgi:hypothetical protein
MSDAPWVTERAEQLNYVQELQEQHAKVEKHVHRILTLAVQHTYCPCDCVQCEIVAEARKALALLDQDGEEARRN